jgi:hypothetical protein
LTPHSNTYGKARKLSLTIHPGFRLRNPGMGILKSIFPTRLKKIVNQVNEDFPDIKINNTYPELSQALIKSKLIRLEDEVQINYRLKQTDWSIVQVFVRNTSKKTIREVAFIVLNNGVKLNGQILLKSKMNEAFNNTSAILKYIPEYQSDLSLQNTEHHPKLLETFNCFASNSELLKHKITVDNINRILIFQKNLKDYIQQHHFERNNRNFKSNFKTHKSPMEISIFEDHTIFKMNDYRFFPSSIFENHKKHIQRIKYLINQIQQLS